MPAQCAKLCLGGKDSSSVQRLAIRLASHWTGKRIGLRIASFLIPAERMGVCSNVALGKAQ